MKKKKKTGCFSSPVVIILLLFLLIGSCGGEADPAESTVPTTDPIESIIETTEPVATTEPTTVPTTEPAAEPTTEPSTDPSEEPEPAYTYILNTNTKKFHEEWCSSVDRMKEKNKKVFTGTRDEVIAKGYDPCSRCNP